VAAAVLPPVAIPAVPVPVAAVVADLVHLHAGKL
jgi:hypothetical protein